MTPSRFIYATGQRWKLALPLTVVAIAGLAIVLQSQIRPLLGADYTMIVVLFATFLGLSAFAVPCIGLRCPRCRAKLFWSAVSKQHSSAWLVWLLSLDRCPQCEYAPGVHEHAV